MKINLREWAASVTPAKKSDKKHAPKGKHIFGAMRKTVNVHLLRAPISAWKQFKPFHPGHTGK